MGLSIFQSPKPFLLLQHLLMISIISFVFFLLIPFATPLSFNFPKFDPNDHDITLGYDAFPSDGTIQLTGQEMVQSRGQATYYQPMHLWDKATANLTNFTTHFSFAIDSQKRTSYADGLAFFLAPYSSPLNNSLAGGAFGLPTIQGEYINSTNHPFVAVEFDTYVNDWDPPYEHVGIDINSINSSDHSVRWWSSVPNGTICTASISYVSSSKNLSVVFTGFPNGITVMESLSYVVDLRDYLPEWVAFGFSGATGDLYASHIIYSWSFNSSLEIA